MKTNKFFYVALIAMAATAFTMGCKDEAEEPLPPIGGYNSADEVGSADLIAYFPMNGSGTESKSGVSPDGNVNATFVSGIKSNAVHFAEGYFSYPSIAALAATSESMTISMWAKISNNQGTAGGFATMLFSIAREHEWAGSINMMAETGWRKPESDTLVMKGLVVIKNGDAANWQDIINSANPSEEDIAAGHVAKPNKNGGKWAQYVIVWNAVDGSFKLYANGEKISNPVWESRNQGNPLPLNFWSPALPVIGTFQTVIEGTPDGWQKSMTGDIDEIRVWKKALVPADINSLYELEKAGR